jgi:hypothetical protein
MASHDRTIRVWDTATARVGHANPREVTTSYHKCDTFSIVFGEDGLHEPPYASAADEGAGVHRLDGTASHRKITERMRERRSVELRRWGAPDTGSMAEQLAQAEACAEAASAAKKRRGRGRCRFN